MTPDDFEPALRHGLAMLAREAVPDEPEAVAMLPPMRSVGARRERRLGPRLIAAGITIAVATASIAVALSVRGGSHTRTIAPSSSWTKIAASPLEPRSSQVAVFTGRDVIIWGGRSDSAGNVAPAAGPGTPRYSLGDGAAYDVAADRWRMLPRAPIAGRYDAVAVWTGKEMLVVGGARDHAAPQGGIAFLRDGAAYDPAHNQWRRLPEAPTCPAFGAWTGAQLIVGGTCANRTAFAAYDPGDNRWTALPVFASASQLVAAGERLYAWTSATGRGAVYQPDTRRWRALPAVPGTDRALQDSVAIAYRTRLAVVGREADPMGNGPDLAFAAILGPEGWTSIASRVGSPAGDTVVAASDGAVMWSNGVSLAAETIDRPMRGFSLVNVEDAPISLERLGESIVGIGYRRFLVWGGRLAGTRTDPTNRPTADGAIVQVHGLDP